MTRTRNDRALRSVLRAEAIQSLRSIPGSARERISSFIDLLGSDSTLSGDYRITDSTARIIEIKVLGSHAITFWADHAAREIKITDIHSADRA